MNSNIRQKPNSIIIAVAIVGICIALIAGVMLISALCNKPEKIFSLDRSLYIMVQERDESFVIQEYIAPRNEANQTTEYRGKFGFVSWSNDSSKYSVCMDGVFSDVNLVEAETGYIVDYDTIIGITLIEQIEKKLSLVIEKPKRLTQHYEFVTWSKDDALICVYFELSEQTELRFRGYVWLDLRSNEIVDLLILENPS